MCHPEPFHIFKSNIFAAVKREVPQVDMAWLEQHNNRLSLYWNAGESSISAASTMIAFAKGAFSATYAGNEKSPLQLAKRVINF